MAVMLLSACAMSSARLPDQTEQRLRLHMTSLIDDHFPELENVPISFRSITPAKTSYTFSVGVERYTYYQSPENRRYIINVNSAMVDQLSSEEVLNALLVHELFHIQDYMKTSSSFLRKRDQKYSKDPGYRIAYERITDLRTMKLGFAEGLKRYRKQLYENLSADQLTRIRKTYYTPEEIEAWLNHPH